MGLSTRDSTSSLLRKRLCKQSVAAEAKVAGVAGFRPCQELPVLAIMVDFANISEQVQELSLQAELEAGCFAGLRQLFIEASLPQLVGSCSRKMIKKQGRWFLRWSLRSGIRLWGDAKRRPTRHTSLRKHCLKR